MDEQNDYLKITFDTIDEGITIYDEQFCLVVWNKQYKRMGITPNEHLYRGASLLDAYRTMARNGIFGEGDPEELANRRIESLRKGSFIASEFLNATTNRLIRINRFHLSNGGICATFRDVTEERKLEQQVRQMAKLDALGRLTGGVAHDLNNILAIIVGNLEIAQLNAGRSDKHVDIAIDACERGSAFIKDLLAFTRQQPLKPTVICAYESLRAVTAMLDPLLKNSVRLMANGNDDLWPVEVDGNQFQSTIMNLIMNARDASTAGSIVSIELDSVDLTETDLPEHVAGKPGRYLRIAVADSGKGMSQAVLENAIDPFFTTKPAGKGTGLGLSMAHGFAQQSNGWLTLDSTVDIGTTVVLHLPLSDKALHVTHPTRSKSVNLPDLKVLVVDDDQMVLSSVEALVNSFGCEVTTKGSGLDAMAMGSWDQFDVLITDVSMPDLDGVVLADLALQKNSALKVIFMSGHANEYFENRISAREYSKVLTKPFRRSDLLDAVMSITNENG